MSFHQGTTSLQNGDYTSAGVAEVRKTMETLTNELREILGDCGPDWVRQSPSADALEELSHADAVLRRIYRAARSARQDLEVVDERARDHFYDRLSLRA